LSILIVSDGSIQTKEKDESSQSTKLEGIKMVICSPTSFLTLGLRIVCKQTTIQNKESDLHFFRSAFNASPDVCSHVWEYVSYYELKPRKALPKHLLWALIFLKSYATEPFLAGLVGASEKTFRKWIWLMIETISRLYSKIVS
jgi:hypothetical protein